MQSYKKKIYYVNKFAKYVNIFLKRPLILQTAGLNDSVPVRTLLSITVVELSLKSKLTVQDTMLPGFFNNQPEPQEEHR